jgi:hypothetical protein
MPKGRKSIGAMKTGVRSAPFAPLPGSVLRTIVIGFTKPGLATSNPAQIAVNPSKLMYFDGLYIGAYRSYLKNWFR